MTTDTLGRVRGLVAQYLKIPADTIGEDAKLDELGLDSLGALELVFEIEEEFKVKVPDERIPEFRTVRAVCDGIEALRGA
ncbi:MAG: acyl carrier protein [Vicinamibacteria bacterium]